MNINFVPSLGERFKILQYLYHQNIVIFQRYIVEIPSIEGYRQDNTLQNIDHPIFPCIHVFITDISMIYRYFANFSVILMYAIDFVNFKILNWLPKLNQTIMAL